MFRKFTYYSSSAILPSYTGDFVAALLALEGIVLSSGIIAALSALEAELTAATLLNYLSPSSNIIKVLYPYVGGVAASHKYNFLDPRDLDAAYRITWSGGVTHNANGITGNGVNGTGDTHWVPSSQIADELSFSSYNRTGGNDAGADIVAYNNSGTSIADIFSKWTDSKTYYSANATAEDDTSGLTPTGLLLSTSVGTTSQRLDRNGANVDSAAKTLGKPNRSFRILGMSGIGFSSRNLALNHISDVELDATQSTAFYTAVQNFQTALSRQV